MPILFAMVGATGIGKSALSLELAERFDAEIIGVDSRQVYKDFCIGTAQPDALSLKRVPHHLVNFLEPEKTFSAGAFCRAVKNLLTENPQKNFILVGGTGLYIQSLFLGLPKIPPVPEEIRNRLEILVEKEGPVSLYQKACAVDPELAETVEPNNAKRLVRILEVFEATGRKLSEFQKEREGGIGNYPVFWLQRDRDVLYDRINARVDQMMRDGWLEEIRELEKTVPLAAPAWQSLGYRELLGAKTPAQVQSVLEDVKRKTRNYAKRQLTWFRWQLDCTPVDMENKPLECILGSLR
jgi:tRNA dimethylallyltransferase